MLQVADPAEHPASAAPVHVLIVEDDSMIADVAARALTGSGYRVLVAGTGAEAVDLAGRYTDRIRVALVDLHLPDTTGELVLSALVERCPSMRAVAMSGSGMSSMTDHLLELGFSGVLQKPYRVVSLRDAVLRLLGGSTAAAN